MLPIPLRKTVAACAALLAVLGLIPAAGAALAKPPPITVVPRPARLSLTAGAFVLGPQTVLAVPPGPEARPIAEMLAHRLRVATGDPVPVVTVAPHAPTRKNAILFSLTHADPALGPEGYTLTATPSGVLIRAPHPAGLFYGTQTLRQLLPPALESQRGGAARVPGIQWRVPGVRIWDSPRFPVRGLMLDSSRHFQSAAFITRTLDRMASHKLNTFHWHLSDDQGWRIEIKRFPRLTQVGAWRDEGGRRYGGFYTQDQIRGIVAYAAARYITIIPELDMPAHCNAALASYPALGCIAGPFHVLRVGEFTAHVLDPAKPGTYDFVDGVFSEVMALFPSRVIHIGGDECPKDEWRASPECQALMRREGLPNETALQNYFTRRVAAFFAAHGRRLQGWNEILQGGPLPADAIVQQWNEPRAAAVAAQAGHDVVVSLASHVYFDASNEAIPLKWVYGFEPMPPGLTPAQARHIRGVEACLWTESKPTEAICDEYLWPRLTALAEVGWSPAALRDWPDFWARLRGGDFPRLAAMGVGTEAALLDRSNADWGARVGEWVPSQMSETWETQDWDITPDMHGAGTYTLRLNYEAGADGVRTSSVELRADGQPVALDTHDGWAGGVPHDRTYRLPLKTYDPQAHYTVRVRLRSDGGTDSRGALWLQGPG